MTFKSAYKNYNCFCSVPVPLHSDHKAVIRQVEEYLNNCTPDYVRRVKRGFDEVCAGDADFLKCFFIVQKYYDPKRFQSAGAANLINVHPFIDVVFEEVVKAVVPFGPIVFALFEMILYALQGVPLVDRIYPFLMHVIVGFLPFYARVPVHYIYNSTMPLYQGRLRVGMEHKLSPELRDRIWYYMASFYNYHYLPMDFKHWVIAMCLLIVAGFFPPSVGHYVQILCIFFIIRYLGAFREELFKTFLEPMLFPGLFFGIAECIAYLRNGVSLYIRIPALLVHTITDYLPYHESVFFHVTFNDIACLISLFGFNVIILYNYVAFWVWLRFPTIKSIFRAKIKFAASKFLRERFLVFDRKEILVQLLEDFILNSVWFFNPQLSVILVTYKVGFKCIYAYYKDKDWALNYVFSELMVSFYFTLPLPLSIVWHYVYNRCCVIQDKREYAMNIHLNLASAGFSIESLYDKFTSVRDTEEMEAFSKLIAVLNAVYNQDFIAMSAYAMDRSYDFYCSSLLEYFAYTTDEPEHNAFTGTKLHDEFAKVLKSFYYSKFLGEFEVLKPIVAKIKKLNGLSEIGDIGTTILNVLSELHNGVMGYIEGKGFFSSLSPSKSVVRRKIRLEILNLENNEPTIEELDELVKRIAREVQELSEHSELTKDDKEYYDFLISSYKELLAKSENLRKRENPMPIWLIGSSGTGKTEAASAIMNMLLTASNALNDRSDHAGQVLPIFLNNKYIAETKKSKHVRGVQVNDIDADQSKAEEQGRMSLGAFSQMAHDSFPFNFPSAGLLFKTMLENDIEVITYTSNHMSFTDSTDMEKNIRRYSSGVMAMQTVIVDGERLDAHQINCLSEEKRNSNTFYILLSVHASRKRLWFKETDIMMNQVDFMKYVSDRFGVHLAKNARDRKRVDKRCACGLSENYHWTFENGTYKLTRPFPSCDMEVGESDTVLTHLRTVGRNDGTKELFERPETKRPSFAFSPAAWMNELQTFIGVNTDGNISVVTSASQAERRKRRYAHLDKLRNEITDFGYFRVDKENPLFTEQKDHLKNIRERAAHYRVRRNRLAVYPVHNAGEEEPGPEPVTPSSEPVQQPELPFYLKHAEAEWKAQRSAWALLLTSEGFLVLCATVLFFTVFFTAYAWCWYSSPYSTFASHLILLIWKGSQLQWFLWHPWWTVICSLYDRGYLSDELLGGVGLVFATITYRQIMRKLVKAKKLLMVVGPLVALYAWKKSGSEEPTEDVKAFIPRTRIRTRRQEPVHNGFANKTNTDEDTMITQVETSEVYPRTETKRLEWGRSTHVNTVTMGLVRTDPEGLRKSINAQVKEFRTSTGLKANALIVNSSLMVMNKHAFEDKEAVNFQFRDGIISYNDIAEDCYHDPYDDYVFMFNPFSGYFSDLTRFFFDEVPSFSLEAKPYLEDQYYNSDCVRLTMEDKGRAYDHNIYKANVVTEMGDCGKPWVAKTTNGPAIVGIQCVKWDNSSGCTPLSQALIRKATEELGLHIFPTTIFLNTLDTVVSRIRGPVPDNSAWTEVSSPFIKVLGTEGKAGAKFKSDFQYTPFKALEDEFSKPQGIPHCTSSTTDGVYTSAFLKTFQNVNQQGKAGYRFRRFVADIQLKSLNFPADWRRSPLDLPQAFFGDKRQGVERLDFNTSLGNTLGLYDGVPYVDSLWEFLESRPERYALLLREKGYKNKHQLFQELDSGSFVFSNEVREDIDDLIGMLKRGIVPPIAEYVHKDEIRSEEKVNKGHVRLFGNVDFRFNIVMRMYLMPLIAALTCKEMRDRVRMACGINATSHEWDEMICRMKDCLDKWFGMDYACYDTTHDKIAIYFMAYFWGELARMLGYSAINVTIVRNIICSLSIMLVLYKGDWAIITKRMISGIIATLLNNDILNDNNQIGYFIYRNNIAPELSVCTLFEDIVYKTMGDDLLGGVTDLLLDCDPQYLEAMAPAFLMLYGATVTDDTKTADYIHTVDEKDVTFLKRRIVFNEEMNQYVAPLEWDSIIKSLVFEPKKAQPSVYERMGQAWHQAQREACLHGKERLHQLQDRVFAINEALPPSRRYNNLTRVDYGSYINEYVDRQFREEGYATF